MFEILRFIFVMFSNIIFFFFYTIIIYFIIMFHAIFYYDYYSIQKLGYLVKQIIILPEL
jgi:hypothetical protein